MKREVPVRSIEAKSKSMQHARREFLSFAYLMSWQADIGDTRLVSCIVAPGMGSSTGVRLESVSSCPQRGTYVRAWENVAGRCVASVDSYAAAAGAEMSRVTISCSPAVWAR